MTQFRLDTLVDYSDAALLDEVRRVASALPAGPMSVVAFDAVSRVSASTLRRRFGGWRRVLDAAGLGARYDASNESQPREAVLAEVQRVAELLGTPTISVKAFNTHARFKVGAVRAAFGSWPAALDAAGLQPGTRRYTEAECIDNLLRIWTHYGRRPTYGEMSLPPSTISGKVYAARWRSWRKALSTFVDTMNTSADTDDAEPPASGDGTTRTLRTSTPRGVSVAMRYRILVRDYFRCVLCGANPAANPGCQLHVDHVVPYSKGGTTTAENLRTLCAQCNLGKGDRQLEEATGYVSDVLT